MNVRLAKPEEAKEAVEWIGMHDPDALYVVGSKNTMTLVAENGQREMYMPIQAVFMAETLGINPQTKHRNVCYALVDLFKGMVRLAKGLGVNEIYFVAGTEEIQREAKLRGFELVDKPVYRMKVR